MILIENRHYLLKHNRILLEAINNSLEESIIVENSISGSKTMKIIRDNSIQYIHSKYNPEKEAQNFIKQIKNLDQYDHILFFGVGLGYHIRAILEKYPHIKFTICEPNLDILSNFLAHYKLTDMPIKQLESIFIASELEVIKYYLNDINKTLKANSYVCALPVYRNLYPDLFNVVMSSLKDILTGKRTQLAVNVAFQKRWTLNSIKNFPTVLQSPNILHDLDRNLFKEKPAVLVAAGPSLNEELENLRLIKQNNSAYIFSVGSAINALIEHDIIPDAICTYDPQEINQVVIQKVKDLGITNIPLVFGSSVGYETLQNYPGPLLHMLINQDTVAPQLLDITQKVDIISDAPSIAVVTFQMLNLLGFNPIILAGQNLSFKEKKLYAKGIEYKHIAAELSEQETKELIKVPDVNGNPVLTNETFILMKKQFELYIRALDIEVINTTKDGAHIEGTTYIPLTDVIKTKLVDSQIVQPYWYKAKNQYDVEYVYLQLNRMELNRKSFEKQLDRVNVILKQIEINNQKSLLNRMENNFVLFDKEFNKLKGNLFYQTFIEPMLRIQNKLLSDESQKIRYENDLIKKAENIVQAFGAFVIACNSHFQFVLPYFNELQMEINRIVRYSKNVK